MASPKFNSKSPTIKRILREAAELSNSPSPDYHASPASDENLFEWHFTLRGPPSSSFANGIYHGRIVLPPTYPLRPPSFRFLTPSGRFETNREICLSISGHHEETWMPAWGIRTAIVALRAFMETDAKGQLGGLDTTDVERRRIAEGTGNWKCQSCGRSNKEILGECAEAARELGRNGEERAEEKVPEELKIGFKDEKKEKAELANPAVPPTAQQSNDEILTPVSPVANPQQNPAPTSPTPNPRLNTTPASPIAQRIPVPTSPTPHQQAVRVQLQQRSTDGLIWVDRAILGVVICLVLMVVKRVLGL